MLYDHCGGWCCCCRCRYYMSTQLCVFRETSSITHSTILFSSIRAWMVGSRRTYCARAVCTTDYKRSCAYYYYYICCESQRVRIEESMRVELGNWSDESTVFNYKSFPFIFGQSTMADSSRIEKNRKFMNNIACHIVGDARFRIDSAPNVICMGEGNRRCIGRIAFVSLRVFFGTKWQW